MRLHTLLAAIGLLTLAALGHTQSPPLPQVVPSDPAPRTTLTDPIPAPAFQQPVPLTPKPSPPPDPTVDQLMDTLEKLQNQQAALAEQVQVVKAQLAKKAAAQAERMKKLGVEEIRIPRTSDSIPPREPKKNDISLSSPRFEEKPAAIPGEDQAYWMHMKYIPVDNAVKRETPKLPSVEPIK